MGGLGDGLGVVRKSEGEGGIRVDGEEVAVARGVGGAHSVSAFASVVSAKGGV